VRRERSLQHRNGKPTIGQVYAIARLLLVGAGEGVAGEPRAGIGADRAAPRPRRGTAGADMSRLPTLYIRNVPSEIYAALEARAKLSGRSVSGEALAILAQALESGSADV
jgi:antitoxin FitA-like protein